MGAALTLTWENDMKTNQKPATSKLKKFFALFAKKNKGAYTFADSQAEMMRVHGAQIVQRRAELDKKIPELDMQLRALKAERHQIESAMSGGAPQQQGGGGKKDKNKGGGGDKQHQQQQAQ